MNILTRQSQADVSLPLTVGTRAPASTVCSLLLYKKHCSGLSLMEFRCKGNKNKKWCSVFLRALDKFEVTTFFSLIICYCGL